MDLQTLSRFMGLNFKGFGWLENKKGKDISDFN